MLYHLRIFEEIVETVAREHENASIPPSRSAAGLRHAAPPFERWFGSTHPVLSEVASRCLDRYLEAEFDTATPGVRGLGRLSEELPRLAALHRKEFQNATRRGLPNLRKLVKDHTLCGYLFALYVADLPTTAPVEDDCLFRRWIPQIYCPAALATIEATIGENPRAGERATWELATERRVLELLPTLAIRPAGLDRLVLAKYFEAGMLLAILESSGEPEEAAQLVDADPEALLRYGESTASKLYVALNGSLMAYVALTFYHQTLATL